MHITKKHPPSQSSNGTNLYTLALLCLSISTPLVAEGACSKGSEFEPAHCAIKLPAIKTVNIIENAATATAAPAGTDCSTFKLNSKQVKRFFAHVRTTNESDAHHTLDWSPCYASGTLQFSNGQMAHWSINQSRTGGLSINGGPRKFLYCPNCRFTPFQ